MNHMRISNSVSVISPLSLQQEALKDEEMGFLSAAYGQGDRINDLLRSYMNKLIDEKQMLRLSEIKKMNLLDACSLFQKSEEPYAIPSMPPLTSSEQDVMNRLGWYALVPCFETGALRVNTFRYLVFQIQSIDPEKRQVFIRITDYMRIQNVWQMGMSTLAGAQVAKLPSVAIAHTEDRTFVDLYTMYQRKDLGWSEDDYRFWTDIVVRNAAQMDKTAVKNGRASGCDSLTDIFFRTISRCNILLETEKVSRPVKPAGQTRGKREVRCEKESKTKRKIRVVGRLRVTSERPPKVPCLETVITYKTASWTVRGHVRRYKNGKTVYIKPAVHKRKALSDSAQPSAAAIRFRKFPSDS